MDHLCSVLFNWRFCNIETVAKWFETGLKIVSILNMSPDLYENLYGASNSGLPPICSFGAQ